MSKTLTEQFLLGQLLDGYWYINNDGQEDILEVEKGKYYLCGVLVARAFMGDKIDKIECLAPVPSYRQLYGQNDGNIPVGLFTVLKLIKRDIEQYQKIRPLTDLECGIKSHVVSLLKNWGVK